MSERQFFCAIVGGKFRPPALGVLSALPAGFPLLLRREPSNAYDNNAIMVLVNDADAWSELDDAAVNELLAGYGAEKDDISARLGGGSPGFQLGYVPREDASEIAVIADALRAASWRGVLTFSSSGNPRVTFQLPRGKEENGKEENGNEN